MLDVFVGQLVGGPGFPVNSTKWNLCATKLAFSRVHYDAGRFCTWIRSLCGTKIWFVLDGDIKDTSRVFEPNAEYSNWGWKYFVVEEGSVL